MSSSRPSATRGQRTSIPKPEDVSHPLLYFLPSLVLLLHPFEEMLLSSPVIQSLNFGKPTKAPSHCRCCLSSVRDVWIFFLRVIEMTLFPLIKGCRCQETDVNFPAQLLIGKNAQERATKLNHKKVDFFVTEFLIIYLIRCQGSIFFGRRVIGGGNSPPFRKELR